MLVLIVSLEMDTCLGFHAAERDYQAQDKCTLSQQRPPELLYSSWISKRDSLRGAKFGLPLKRVWEAASATTEFKLEYDALSAIVDRIREAGAEVFEQTDFPSAKDIIPPNGWVW